MLTPKPLAAAIAGLLFACAGAAAAQGHVKVFNGYDFAASPAAQPGAATVKSVPLTPLDDPRLAKDLSAGKPPPSAAWFAKFDGVDGSSKNDAPAARPLRTTPGGESHLRWKLENQIITSYQVGGSSEAPMDGGPRRLSAGAGGVPAVDVFLRIKGPFGEAKDGGGVQRALPLRQLPPPSVPQRSPLADGTSNTLMIGEKIQRPAPVPAAPAARR